MQKYISHHQFHQFSFFYQSNWSNSCEFHQILKIFQQILNWCILSTEICQLIKMLTNNCKLNDLKNWKQWNQQFMLMTVAANFWKIIESLKVFKWKSVKLEISFYSSSTQSSTQTWSWTASEDSVDFADLLMKSQKFYISVIMLYKNKLKAYNNQQLVI